MEGINRSRVSLGVSLDELEMPFAPPEPSIPIVSIRTELPKLLEIVIRKLNPDQLERAENFYLRMNSRSNKKVYKEKHPEEYEKWHGTPAGKQIRILKVIASLLRNG